jgi:SAM-dependent methyltransferase
MLKRFLHSLTRRYLADDNRHAQIDNLMKTLTDFIWVQRSEGVLRRLFEDARVVSGPFKGMRYPLLEAHCSSLYPKLLGTYEDELHEVLERLMGNRYQTVIDIGCAEGYYAVGIALRLTGTDVFAYDTSAAARRLCTSMSRANNTESRVHIRDFCSSEILASHCNESRSLVVCDCEGYERVLFDTRFANAYATCDFIIEIHDFIDQQIGSRISDILGPSHQLTRIAALSDASKMQSSWQTKGLSDASLRSIFSYLREGRPEGMYWLVAEATNTRKAPITASGGTG